MEGDASDRSYFALIGDIVGSRGLENRAEIQRTLQATLESLNEELGGPRPAAVREVDGAGDAAGRKGARARGGGSLAAPLKLTAGDEVQGLLVEPAAAVDVVVRIADTLYPASAVWGLGAGSLTTDLGPDVALLDGPCFHRARDAVQAANADGVWLRAEGFPEPHGEALSALFRLMGAVRSRWKPAQVRYIRGARGHLQREVAEMHDVDESTVSKALQAARFRDVEEGEGAARALLEWLGRAVEAGGDPAPESAPEPASGPSSSEDER